MSKETIIYRAHIETRNYDFEGYGATPDAARKAIRRAWLAWRKACLTDPRSPHIWTWAEVQNECGLDIMPIVLDQGYMDREALG